VGAERLLLAGKQVQLTPTGGSIGIIAHVSAPWNAFGKILIILGTGEASALKEIIVVAAWKGGKQATWCHRVDEELVGSSMIAQRTTFLVLCSLGSYESENRTNKYIKDHSI